MKTISIKQPWASLIAHGIKNIENRTWKCPEKYIGTRVLIHASSTPAFSSWDTLNNEQIFSKDESYLKDINICDIPLGAIIGSVEIVSCEQNHRSIWAEKGVWNWALTNPILFDKPISCKGKLSFWEYHNINFELDEDSKAICQCNIGVSEKDQVLSLGDGHYICKYCGGKWYK